MITQENIPYTVDEIRAMAKTCQKYNEARERAKHALDCDRNNLVSTDVSLIYSMFPELAESEDEGIRKALIELVRCNERSGYFSFNNIETSSIIAWLEKQAEQKHQEDCEDGIYLCHEDGYKAPFTQTAYIECMKHGPVTHIGIKVGEHKVGLKLNSLGEQELPFSSDPGSDYFGYKKQELHALDDYGGKANTDHLKLLDEFEFDLNYGEWIPSLGELAIIFKNKEKINEALASIGGDELVEGLYWTSTEYSAVTAWIVSFGNGHVCTGYKGTNIIVRPVCAF